MVMRIASLMALTALLLAAAGPSACRYPGEAQPARAAGSTQDVDEPAPSDSARAGGEEATAPSSAGAEDTEGGGEVVESEGAGEEAEPEPGTVAPSGLQALRAYICKGIEQSEPTEAGKSFIQSPDGVLRLCCFSEIGGAARPDTVYHVWYWGDREMARVPLRVEGTRWRTWSTKRIIDEWRGDWHVDIVDRDGFVLTRLTFSVE